MTSRVIGRAPPSGRFAPCGAAVGWRRPPWSEPPPLLRRGGGSSPVHHFQGRVRPYARCSLRSRLATPTRSRLWGRGVAYTPRSGLAFSLLASLASRGGTGAVQSSRAAPIARRPSGSRGRLKKRSSLRVLRGGSWFYGSTTLRRAFAVRGQAFAPRGAFPRLRSSTMVLSPGEERCSAMVP